MRFQSKASYYRKFCKNFSDVVIPLTNLLKKRKDFVWDNRCQVAFDKVKSMLYSNPVLTAPNFEKPFKLAVDASDFGMGGVLLQDDEHGLEHPVCYFSKKFDNFQRNYSTIEKKAFFMCI